MINLRILKSINLNRIYECRIKLSIYLQDGFISDEDILSLSILDNSYGIQNISSKDLKNNILKEIYNSPFLLCDQKVSDNIKKILPVFLETRYNMELKELESHFELSKEELEFQKRMLKYNYYDSSFEGKDIYKFGHITGITDNKLKIK